MLLLLTLIVIWAGYKFFTQWIWWIIGIMLLIDVWKIVTSWPALLIIAATCFYLLYKRHKEKIPRKGAISKELLIVTDFLAFAVT